MRSSMEYRKEAAQHIRLARRISNPDRRRDRLMLANGLKTLAAAKELLEGLQQRPAPRNARRREQPERSLHE